MIQSHLRRTHLLVDCAQTRIVEQMAELEQMSARAAHVYTKRVSEQNREMKQIGKVAEELAVQTTAAFNILSKLVDLTLKVKQCLSPHEQTQVHHGSALYRSGGNSRASMTLMMQLGGSGANAIPNSPAMDKKIQNFWMNNALPRWTEVSIEDKMKYAMRGAGIPASIRGQVSWAKKKRFSVVFLK
jgi:hypothetical protein